MKNNRIKILGVSKNEHRSIFSFPKEQKLLEIIRNVLMKLGFEGDESLFEFGSQWNAKTKQHIVGKEENIKNYNEEIFNFSDENYSVDIIFFSKKVVLIFNYKEDKQQELSKVFEGIFEE